MGELRSPLRPTSHIVTRSNADCPSAPLGQLRVNHTFPDGGTMSHRLSETFHLHELLQRVDRACRQFDIGVAYEGKLIYVINLDQCYEYLTRVNEGLSVSEYDHTLRAFLDRDLLKAEPRAQDWTLLITHLDSALKSDKLVSVPNQS